ncbi:MAG TPA: Gfo/Idh/MocA family oxidoreductase [Pirellulales bacterium]|nr:Gfo/Idh/MocA family oxidoreductase [Pirellulales bacterium]
MPSPLSRREFLRQAALAGATAVAASQRPAAALAKPSSPNERLNIGVIGVAGRGAANLAGVEGENIVALCDIDAERLDGAAKRFPHAKTYADYRKLLDLGGLDAVVVSTPDHTHAIPVVWALQRGLDVYCEKPLAHSVYEARQMREWAARQKAVTQMGTQIHNTGDNYRRVVEIVQAGVLGKIERVHVWLKPGFGTIAGHRAAADSVPPKHVDYDLWTGPAPLRPFDPSHFHFNWRYWFEFGGGWLADFGCHYMDLPFWALDLRYPTSVVAKGEKTSPGDQDIPDNMQVEYRFPSRGDLPPVHMTWYHGSWRPEGAEAFGDRSAVLFEGQHGRLVADYGTHQLFLEPGLHVETPPATIPSSIGHHLEWIQACKTRAGTTCNFDYSGALAETVLLGNVSYRAGGKLLEWDGERLKATNGPEAERFIRREYRKGWTLEG